MTGHELNLGGGFGLGLGLRRSAAENPAFHPEEILTGMFGGDLNREPRASGLNPVQREELLSLAREQDPQFFWAGLQDFAARQEQAGHLEIAARVYTAIAAAETAGPARPRAQQHLDAILGRGALGPRAEFLLRRLAQEASEPTALIAMGVAGTAFRLTRLATLSRLAATPGGNFLTRGFGARAVASLVGFAVETPTFTLAGRLAGAGFGRQQDWSAAALRRDFASSFIVLGGLKLSGWAAGAAFNRIHGINPLSGGVQRLAGLTGLSQRLVPQLGMLGGILLGHHVEERVGLRDHVNGATTMVDSLAMLLQFNIAGRLTQHAFGARFHAWERGLDQQTELLARGNRGAVSPLSASRLEALRNLTASLGPTPALAALGRAPMASVPTEPASRPQILMSQMLGGAEGSAPPAPAAGESRGPAPRRLDPEQTLAVLPVGTLTPHGNERTTYERAVGDPHWYAEVGVLNGHLDYRGDGVYADKASGEVLTLGQIGERYGERIRGETGFRSLASDHPIETDWAGQIPTGLRGPEGETEGHLLALMGLSKSQIKGLRFNASTSYLHGSDQFALQGLYALYRSAVQWGLPLDAIVGRDPRRMGLSLGAGLGGMNNLIDLITASTRRRMRDGVAGTATDPATGPLVLPALLIDSMQGLFTAVLGPKGTTLPTGLSPETVIRTVGRIPVDVGACATGYKAFADAADMFRPVWPGQTPTELAFFGSSEAAHGRSFARPEATGFNAMKAMETRDRLAKRNGRIEDGYAPLTTDVLGFWPSEGAGVGALMRLNRAIELGLPVEAGVAGYSITGDQGGKAHPAGLGLGGVSSLMESLNMARDWQGLDPRDLQYMNLHGTGTPDNNKIEPSNLLAVLDAFGYEGPLHLSAYKALLGHGLGAAGSMEIGLLMMALRRQLAPGAFNLEGRQLDPNVAALGNRVIVSSAPVRGPLRFVGGQSQGFAGNNGSALFRAIDDQVLHEIFGYSIPEIEAYRSRLSERREVAERWEEDIRTGRKTIGEFLSWFGLSEKTPERATTVVLPGAAAESTAPGPISESAALSVEPVLIPLASLRAPASESVPPPPSEIARMVFSWNRDLTAMRVPRTDPAHPDYIPMALRAPTDSVIRDLALNPEAPGIIEARPEPAAETPLLAEAPGTGSAPAFLRGIRVRPEQMIVSLGRGSMLTTRGTARATRAAAMHGVDASITLAYLSEDFGLTRYNGRDAEGRETWLRAADGAPMSADQIAGKFGETLLTQSGIREIPLEGAAQNLPVRHGGLIPEPLRGSGRLLARMGLDTPSIKGGPFENQKNNLGNASDSGAYGLYSALAALGAFGRPLSETFASSRFGVAQGSAFPGLERFIEISDRSRTGLESTPYQLQSALNEDARGLLMNLLMPHFDFAELKTNPRAIERILPPSLAPGQMPNTGGVNLACSAACASGLYALFGARQAMLRSGLPGEYPMDAMMVFGADATFSPYASSPIVAGFSRRAPMTVDSMVKKLVEQGRLGPEVAQLKQAEREALWETLPVELRRQAMSESSAPFTRYARGLVVAEAAAGMPWVNFQRAIELGLWPSSRLLGIHVNSGEGGAPNLAAMDQGVVTSTLVALAQAWAHGQAVPQVVQTHGTSTELNNIAEIQSLYQAFRYAGLNHPMSVSAIKGLVGHSMGAASAVDMVMGVQSLLDGEAPGLFNFRSQDLDPRFAEKIPGVLDQLRFGSDPIRGGIENILLTSEGFLSSDAAAVLGRFPQDAEGAVELLRDYGVPEHQRAEWRVRADEHRGHAAELEEGLRRGRYTLRDLLDALRFRP